MDKNILEQVGHQVLIGLGRIGGRAVAAGVKSVLKDGSGIAKEAQRRFESTAEKIEAFVNGGEEK